MVCEKCGTEAVGDAEFCRKCGSKMTDSAEIPSENQSEDTPENKKKKKKLELIIVILLGITTVATSWATWQGSLHGSQMEQKYTMSTNLSAESNAEYNLGMQAYTSDLLIFNDINNMRKDQIVAYGAEFEKLERKIEETVSTLNERFMKAFQWSLDERARTGFFVSPFDNEELMDSYFEKSERLSEESEKLLHEGNINNAHSDNLGLVIVLYAVVLFLLGIASSFKGLREKYVLVGVSAVCFIGATIFMLTIPIVMP